MNIIADLHTHTIKSITGTSTLKELTGAASQEKLKCIAVTDYGPKTNMSKKDLFKYISYLPEKLNNIQVIKGIEADVMELHSGKLDISDAESDEFDWITGAYHEISEYDKQILNNTILTNLYLNMANNPILNTISHMEREECGFDTEKVLSVMKQNGKVVEISAAHFDRKPDYIKKRLISLIKVCKEDNIPICIVSNAHSYSDIGKFEDIKKYFESISFPEELIINSDKELLFDYIKKFKELKKKKLEEQQINTLRKRGGARPF